MTPADRYKQIREPMLASYRAELKGVIEEYERKRIKWYRLIGADTPLTGHRNRALRDVLIDVVKSGWDYYPSETDALNDFKEAATIYQRRNHGVDYGADDIIAIPGVAAGYQIIHNAILDPGDEVVIIEPAHYTFWPASYMWALKAKVVQVPMIEERKWTTDIDALRKAVNSRTKAIVIDNPNNPTGHIYSEKEQKAIVDVAGEHGIPIVSDELYCPITYDGYEATTMAKASDDVPVVVMTSFSKLFMLPGWRIGYLAFHDPKKKLTELKKVCKFLSETYGHPTTAISLPILVAGTKALLLMKKVHDEIAWAQDVKGPMDESMEMLKRLQRQKDYTYKRLSEIEGITVVDSMATLYMFPNLEWIGKVWKTNEDFCLELLRKEKVGVFSGSFFGDHGFGHFRVTLLNDLATLEEVYNRLDRFMKAHAPRH